MQKAYAQVHTPDYVEEDLIRTGKRGDRESFALLYETHADRAYQYFLGRLGEPAND